MQKLSEFFQTKCCSKGRQYWKWLNQNEITVLCWKQCGIIVWSGLVLRRFVLQPFTITTIVQSDWALQTCGASLSQLKHPFCTSSYFLVCMCFFFLYISAVLLSWLWFFHPWCPSKRQKRRKNQDSWRYILYWCLLNHGLSLHQQNRCYLTDIFFSISCIIFYAPNSLNENCVS